MASIYDRPNSPFFWAKYRDPLTGKIRRESTGIRLDAPGAKTLASRRRAQLEMKELSAPQVRPSERWEAWAYDYLANRHVDPGTCRNSLKCLPDLLTFFREHEVMSPRQLSYDITRRFERWRSTTRLLPKIHHNTARLRFIYLRVLMSEAVRRGYADINPCREVSFRKIAAKEKEEITLADEKLIEEFLSAAKLWMREHWLVLMRQGCRVSEAMVPLARIDTEMMTIVLRLKGGKLHSAPLHPDLLPLVAQARLEGRPTLIVAPPSSTTIWSLWFKNHRLNYSAHCTRVTVITRLLRAGHSPAKVCAFIGHSEEVNVIYRRLKPPDARDLLATLSGAGDGAKARSSRRRASAKR